MRRIGELEQIALRLHQGWARKTILHLSEHRAGLLDRILGNVQAEHLQALLRGKRVHGVERRGRHLLVTLQTGVNPYRWPVLQWTLGPAGDWFEITPDAPAADLELQLEGASWGYQDTQSWGEVWLWSNAELAQGQAGRLRFLGPDWLRQMPDAIRAIREFRPVSRMTAKTVLLDQSIAAGADNTLACEALHAAGVHPHHPWRLLTPGQRSGVGHAMAAAATAPLRDPFFVYGREGDWCLKPDCLGTICTITDTTHPNRRSWFCPNCQPAPEVAE